MVSDLVPTLLSAVVSVEAGALILRATLLGDDARWSVAGALMTRTHLGRG